MICVLIVWLHIRAGVSRSVANRILHAIQLILSTTLHLIEAALSSSGINISLSKIVLPRDIRTAYRHHFSEPDITRTACCPKCFSLFPRPIPWHCNWRASPRSNKCNTELWKVQNTQHGPKWVPRCLYTTQSFDSWLRSFLSRPEIETSLEETFRRRKDYPTAFGADMNDIQDSPAWKALYTSLLSPFQLLFGIYIDWFNPFTNKIAGLYLISSGLITSLMLI